MRRLILFIPLIGLTLLSIFLYRGLMINDKTVLPSPLLNKPVPVFQAKTLAGKPVTQAIFRQKITLLNVWASWCVVCRIEHDTLTRIAKNNPDIQLIGLNYKDTLKTAQDWLLDMGNPYQQVIHDPKGMLGLDLGVYGAPESYLIDPQGRIRYKHVGALTQQIWDQQLLPVIQQIQDTAQ